MRLIEPKVERLVQKPGIEGMYEIIDIVAGTSHGRSKPHKDPKKFVEKLISMGHLSPLESGTVYLLASADQIKDHFFDDFKFIDSPYAEVRYKDGDDFYCYITTNYRVLVENECMYALKYWCEPTEFHKKRSCFKFTLSRGIADEFVRHRSLSPVMKSTRYNKDFDIVLPRWLANKHEGEFVEDLETALNKLDWRTFTYVDGRWWISMVGAAAGYKDLLDTGLTPQEARGVMPLDIATELTLCGFDDVKGKGWENFLKQRCDKAAHPDARYLAEQVKEMLNQKN